MFSAKLNCVFDSHLHWLGTGEVSQTLSLHHLAKPENVKDLKIRPHHYSGTWLKGFGWDQNKWPEKAYPHRRLLDQYFPNHPVAFSRVDGHAYWVNSLALELAGLVQEGKVPEALSAVYGEQILLDEKGAPSGILLDTAKSPIEKLIPPPTSSMIQAQLLEGMRLFHKKGITHIRDMSCSQEQWNEALHLDASGVLKLAVLQTFSADDPKDFEKALSLAEQARRDHTPHLRPHAIKIYYDGALGSEGALVSQAYSSGSKGFRLLTPKEFGEILQKVWEAQWPLAIHTLGDEAVDQVVSVACQLWDRGLKGSLHLEHVELLRPETAEKMKGRPITCHLQPCHWLSDRHWLKEKISSLADYAFPWGLLENLGIPFYFGSDSPIEPLGIDLNLKALEQSKAEGIPALQSDPLKYHQYWDPQWTPNTYTLFESSRVARVVFEGAHLI